ncbi:Terpenoid synthase [Mycena sanguinolenta]|uniref:Terpenoid synthase n=1 Tax=Mycena sanguinolenta TaxID=230812 RepID=A0A8H6XYE0_9AGAR|nr:Terpenoid synthase [Mycena sanguinolenta]
MALSSLLSSLTMATLILGPEKPSHIALPINTDYFQTSIQDDALELRAIIGTMLDLVGYEPSNNPRIVTSTTKALEKSIAEEIGSWNIDDGHSGAVLASNTRKAVSLIQFWYPHHSFEVKFTFGLYAWFFFYIDDCVSAEALEDYQRNLLLGRPQADPALARYHEVLAKVYDHWDSVCANFMVCAAMEFVSGTIVENRPETMTLPVVPTAPNWPKYLRAKSGLGSGAACALFPRKVHPDLSAYIQVLPDIDDFTCLVNDILSFYKEELAGETTNYVHVRSKTSLKTPKQVLVEMVHEVGNIHTRVAATLAGHPEALAAWTTFETGYIAWHLSIERYKLSQLGFRYS